MSLSVRPAVDSSIEERIQSSSDAGPRPSVASPRNASDVFDQENFDATAYINEMFPTESSLVGLDPLIQRLRTKIKRLDANVLAAVRHQSSTGSQARQDLDQANLAIEELFGKINDIRRKAEQSEVMVQEICRDIKKLDYAKQHLTQSITALRRFAMLCNAVDQLQTAAERGEFGEAAHLVEAVQQLSAHFQGYASIPKVAELNGRLQALQASLQIGANREFELLGMGEEPPSAGVLERLKACCALIDALGHKARDDVVDSLCKKEIGVYSQIFSGTGETAALDRTERRFVWLRNRLQKRGPLMALFPARWKFQQQLCLRFCAATRDQLAQSLEQKAGDLGSHVEALLMAVKSTNDFENEMAQKFGGKQVANQEPDNEDAEDDDEAPASQVRQRYERMFREKQKAGDESPGSEAATADTSAQTAFHGAISTVFAKYLRVYVEAEERALSQQLDTLMREETWAPMEDAQQTRVLHSSSNLFAIIKRCVQRCSKYVSRGEALLQLLGAFQRVLKAYVAKLHGRLPRTQSGSSNVLAQAGTTDWQIKMSDEDMTVVCTIIATAEYCSEVVGSLGRSIAKTLEPPYNEQVDVQEEEEEFQGLVTACLSTLILAVQTRLDAPLQQMCRMPWATMEVVGDQSEFVNGVSRVMSEIAPRLGSALSELHFRYFCDKLASSFCQCYFAYIFRCKKIGEAGSQQLLLDTQAIKGLLLEFPTAGRPDEPIPAALSGYVTREMARAEALLKVIGSRPDNLADNFATLMPNAPPALYQRILDLKVLKRQEQLALTDALGKRGGRQALSLPPTAATPVSDASAIQMAARNTAAQDFAAKFRFSSNTTASAAAAAAGEKMREKMAGSFAAMKNLNIGFSRQNKPS